MASTMDCKCVGNEVGVPLQLGAPWKFRKFKYQRSGFYLENLESFNNYVWEGPTRSVKILQRVHDTAHPYLSLACV